MRSRTLDGHHQPHQHQLTEPHQMRSAAVCKLALPSQHSSCRAHRWDRGSGIVAVGAAQPPPVHCTSPQHCAAPLWYTAHPLSTVQHPSECFSLSMLKTHKHLQVDIEPPDHLCCPLTLTLLDDPISGPDGRTYSRAAITKALALKEVLVLCAFAPLPLPYCLCPIASVSLPLSHAVPLSHCLCFTVPAPLPLPHCLVSRNPHSPNKRCAQQTSRGTWLWSISSLSSRKLSAVLNATPSTNSTPIRHKLHQVSQTPQCLHAGPWHTGYKSVLLLAELFVGTVLACAVIYLLVLWVRRVCYHIDFFS